MRLGLAQMNPVVGDIAGNTKKIGDFLDRAQAEQIDLVVFPELTIVGYPPKDLLLKPRLVRDNLAALEGLASRARRVAALVGFVRQNPQPRGRSLQNAAALLSDGRIASVHEKALLPTYDVFDESRYFQPGEHVQVACWRGRRLGISICEDLWSDQSLARRTLYDRNPIAELVAGGAEILINLSASPFEVGKNDLRQRLFARQVARQQVALAFCNQVGGNDELIFDGASCVFGKDGRVVARAKAFAEDLLVVDLDDQTAGRIECYPDRIESLWQALVLGVRDYAAKCGFGEVVVGLSGGIDSSVTAAIAAEALGPRAVHGVAMPSRYSSPDSLADAEQVARNLGICFQVISIGAIHETFEQQLQPHFAGREPDVTEENIQARIRGSILMALSNKFGWLVLATGNKSELSVGYCTLYGDMVGGLAAIGDVPKMMVYELARHINARAGREIIPARTISKPPSAELRPGQVDQDSLPPYETLDRILHAYIEQERSLEQITAEGFDPQLVSQVIWMVDRNEYKRKQAPPVLKVTARAFGSGRRMPIAARYSSPARQ